MSNQNVNKIADLHSRRALTSASSFLAANRKFHQAVLDSFLELHAATGRPATRQAFAAALVAQFGVDPIVADDIASAAMR